ncbi:MAG: hypothetical protein B6U87_02360 [Candidatus Aenigmarchaeota archaeon ex4484_52]|nr:MAG: hypothetical protein B6U87_02360 [Candidatus Aenigmarchaeota archaeon ex4484_52]
MWVELFLYLGFFGYYILWALFVGIIAIFNFKKDKIIRNLFLSFIAGIILISIGPIEGIIASIFVRLFIIGIKKTFDVKNFDSLIKGNKEIVVLKSSKILTGLSALIVFLMLSIIIFAPPMEVKWYKMDNAKIEIINHTSSFNADKVIWEDIKDTRLVCQEYALQIPKTMVTETGWQLSKDWDGIYPINNTLYWVMVYEPTTLVNMKNPSPAYILVNGADPAKRFKIKEKIKYSEQRSNLIGLIYQILTTGKIYDVKIKYWLKYPFFNYGDAVFTHDDNGEPIWFAPIKMNFPTIFIIKFYTEQIGIVTLDNNGQTKIYSNNDIKNKKAPDWLLNNNILIDEQYSQMRMDKWAKYAHWKNFLNYYFQHENVFELAQRLFFQYDKTKDHAYGFMQLEPEGKNRKAITHFANIDASGENFGDVLINDIRQLELIGPKRALSDVRGQISLYSDWYALQPLFRKIKGSYFYIIPVYSGIDTSMVLRAIAVVDAKTEQVKLFKWEDVGLKEEIRKNNVTETINSFNQTQTKCSVVSAEKINSKLRIVMECDSITE